MSKQSDSQPQRSPYRFPRNFVWGCATASYQVEGAVREDGRGPSIWDTFSHTPGRTALDHTGDVSVDQYHRYKEDVGLMAWLGLKAYRFSIAWPRVMPQGTGKVNPKGLDYYDRLVDELLAHGIQPWATLFHWDLPQALEDRWGGWLSRQTAEAFADYATAVVKRLSDRLTHYFTINEFVCFTDGGYSPKPWAAPGRVVSRREQNQARHHGLLAHGLAVQAIRAHARRKPLIGLAENINCCVPVLETAEHIAAARTALRTLNAPFLTAVMEGRYLDAYLRAEGANAPAFTDADLGVISNRLDFVGLNIYAPTHIRADADSPAGFAEVPHPESYPRLGMPWLYINPQSIYWGPRLVSELWRPGAIYITENGCASDDRPAADGGVYDTDRVMYLRNHLIAAQRAVSEGWPLRGYFLWSLLDNFEWCWGYTKRFGIFYVNYATLARVPKLSAHFYRATIARNALA